MGTYRSKRQSFRKTHKSAYPIHPKSENIYKDMKK